MTADGPYRTPAVPAVSAIDLLADRIAVLRERIRAASWWQRRRLRRDLEGLVKEHADLTSKARIARIEQLIARANRAFRERRDG